MKFVFANFPFQGSIYASLFAISIFLTITQIFFYPFDGITPPVYPISLLGPVSFMLLALFKAARYKWFLLTLVVALSIPLTNILPFNDNFDKEYKLLTLINGLFTQYCLFLAGTIFFPLYKGKLYSSFDYKLMDLIFLISASLSVMLLFISRHYNNPDLLVRLLTTLAIFGVALRTGKIIHELSDIRHNGNNG